jgi:hypothetical protein
MYRRRLLLGLSAFAATSCASRPAPPRAAISPPAAPPVAVQPPAASPRAISPGPGPAELEAIYGVTATREALTLRVASNGCTAKPDFAFFVERKDGVTTVAFARKRLDTCRTIRAGHADLVFTLQEMGIAPDTPVFVLNPLSGL